MRWLARPIGLLMAGYVRLVSATCRVYGAPVNRDQAVLAFWHEYNLVAATAAHRLRRHQHHVSFSTRTFRGEVMTSMLAALDAGSVALPPEGERSEATRLSLELARLGREGASLVISPDGPIGPYRRAKPGALIVAREAGVPIQPWAVAARPVLRLRGRWDRHIVPLPFCRVRVEQAEPITVGSRERLRPLLSRLQAALDDATARAERALGSK
ncbi:MAG: lysophospholipid acyltransferase family protein [Candidatus Limnocylindria bacterium]